MNPSLASASPGPVSQHPLRSAQETLALARLEKFSRDFSSRIAATDQSAIVITARSRSEGAGGGGAFMAGEAA